MVPQSHMEDLFNSAKSAKSKEFLTVFDGTHNETLLKGSDSFLSAFRKFVMKSLKENESKSETGGYFFGPFVIYN